MRELFSKLTALWHRRSGIDDDLLSEIESHVQFRMDENIAGGMKPTDAYAEALRHVGNTTLIREHAREAWQFPRVETVVQDLRYGFRGLRRTPGFALAVILTLALGIGANTAIFSVVYNVLLRPLPYPDGERLLMLEEASGQASGISVTWINFQHWREENHTFEEMAALTEADLTFVGAGDAQLTRAALVTPAFFRLTGAHALLGRVFSETDDQVGAPGVVVLTWEFWNKAYQGDPAALRATLTLDGRPYQVIGVLGKAPRVIAAGVDYFLPLGPIAGRTANRSSHGSIRALGLLKPGVTLTAARANLDEILQRLALSDPGPESDHRASAEYLTESVTGDVRSTLLILMGAVGLLLLIACANVASLLLVRSAARTREIAIRTAIGAGRTRVVRQMLTENLVNFTLGGMLGVILAHLCLHLLVKLAPAKIPRLSEITLDLPVLCFTSVLTLSTVLLAGIVPALACGKLDTAGALQDGAAGSGHGSPGQRLRAAIVVAEIAITVMLTFASGLLIRSLIVAQNSDAGFDPRNLLALELRLPSAGYKSNEQTAQFVSRLTESLQRLPGVLHTGLVTCAPGGVDCSDWWYSLLERPAPARSEVPLTLLMAADPEYFRTMRIRLLAGREFGPNDRPASHRVVIVNEVIARRWWPNPQAAIGQQIKLGGPYMEGDVAEVVGVAAKVSQMGLDGEHVPQMYFPFSQQVSRRMVVMLRTQANPETLIPAVRMAVRSLDRNLPIQSLGPFEARIGATLSRRRFSTLLLGIFAWLAIVLAGVGVYGVLNFWLSVRSREIAVRMALGASRPAILRWAGWYVLRLAITGVVLGAIGAWSASWWLTHMVYGVSPHSPLTMLAAAAVVIGIAVAASGSPLWRASRVDVIRNLREA